VSKGAQALPEQQCAALLSLALTVKKCRIHSLSSCEESVACLQPFVDALREAAERTDGWECPAHMLISWNAFNEYLLSARSGPFMVLSRMREVLEQACEGDGDPVDEEAELRWNLDDIEDYLDSIPERLLQELSVLQYVVEKQSRCEEKSDARMQARLRVETEAEKDKRLEIAQLSGTDLQAMISSRLANRDHK